MITLCYYFMKYYNQISYENIIIIFKKINIKQMCCLTLLFPLFYVQSVPI